MQVANAVWRGQVTAFIDGEGPYFRPYNKMEQFNLEIVRRAIKVAHKEMPKQPASIYHRVWAIRESNAPRIQVWKRISTNCSLSSKCYGAFSYIV